MEAETETYLYAVKTRDCELAYCHLATSAVLAAKKHVKEYVGESRMAKVYALVAPDANLEEARSIIVLVTV